LADVSGQKTGLEAIKDRLDALEQAVTRAEAEVNTLSARLADAQADAKRAQAAQSVVRETEAGHLAYQAAQANLETLEGQREERDRLKETLQGHTTDLALARQRLEELRVRLGAISAAEAEMNRLRPQVETQERLEGELAEAQRAADRLDHLKRNLEQEQARLVGLEARFSQVQEGLIELAEVEGNIVLLQTEVGTLDQQWGTLTSQVAAHQAELAQLHGQAKQTAKRLADGERSLEYERARLTDLETRLSAVQAGLNELAGVEQSIETLRTELEGLEAQHVALTSHVAAHQAELDQTRTQTAVLEAVETPQCPVCGGPLTAEHRAELLASNKARQAELEVALAEAQSRRRETEKAQDQKQRALRKLEKQARELPRPGEAATLLAQIEVQSQVVARAEVTFEAERGDAATSRARQAELQTTLDELQPQQDEVKEARGQKQHALDQLEKRRKELPRPAEADELQKQVAAQQRNIGEIETAVAELADAPVQVERLTTELDTLGDPRRHFQRAADTADQRSVTELDLAAAKGQIAELDIQMTALNKKLTAYAGLDEHITAEQAILAAHKADHLRYLEHVREAETLVERQERAATVSGELATAQAQCGQLVQERDQVAARYDGDAYARLVTRHSALGGELAALTERLRLQRSQLAEGQTEIERLIGVQSALDAAHAERAELVEVQALLGYIRQVLRDAGPKVTKALVDVISLQAARLYADIMADHTARLQWTEDYEILLATGGRERTFQQLSGGEQMAAALAVRLALLREVSAIDIAFFDEPTANLDDERRDNLAEQILNVKGFSQLFVISHDDTFERDTDHVVRVVKENGVSRAVDQSVNYGMEA
jgi:exonuclease SbcC